MKFGIVLLGFILTVTACGSGTVSSGLKAPASEGSSVNHLETINGKPTFKVSTFAAKYFKGSELIASETVDRVAINYAWSDFHGISSEGFRATWNGNVTILKEEQTLDFNFALSWSEVVVRIDGVDRAKWNNSDKVVPVLLTRGTHEIEVEYINHWHTTNFNMSITQNVAYDKQGVRSAVAPLMESDTRIVVFGAHESGNRYNALNVILSGDRTPVFIVLISYDAVHWSIDNPNHIPIAGVIYNSHHSASTIEADPFIPRFEVKNLAVDYDGFSKASADIKEIFGKVPTKTIGAYNPTSLKL